MWGESLKLASSILFAKTLLFPRSLKKSVARRSLVGAIACIAICVIPLVVVVTVVNGMVHGMTERIISLSSNHLTAYVNRSRDASKKLDELNLLMDSIKNEDGVTDVYPFLENNALASFEGFRTGAKVRAVTPDIFTENQDYKKLFKVLEGNINDFSAGTKNAVIGEHLAELLNIKNGQTFSLVTTKKAANGSIIPKMTSLRVCAIVSSGYQELDALWLFIPIDVGFSVLPMESTLTSVQIKTKDAFSSDLWAVKRRLNTRLAGTATVFSWNELNSSQFQNFASTKIMIDFIVILVVLVALVNISSALVMLVIERKKEIAILKSLGGSSFGITLSFLITGVCCGSIGLLTGLPVGLFLAVNANSIVNIFEKILNIFVNVKLLDPSYYLSEIPVYIPWGELALISLGIIFLSLLVSLIPSIKAGKEQPQELLRKS